MSRCGPVKRQIFLKYNRRAKIPLYISSYCVPDGCSLRYKTSNVFKYKTTFSKITFQHVLSKGEGIVIKSWRVDRKYIFISRKEILTLNVRNASFVIIELVQ
jgi:hypothetical protein